MRYKLAMLPLSFAALTLGAAFVSTPAFAQQQGVSGYSDNGGVIAVHPYRHHAHMRPLYNFAPEHPQKHNVKNPGRLQSNGGM
jgi:hypothetical protein